MEPAKFRKLNIDLPIEPIINDRPWALAGLLCALAFIIIVAYAYLQYKGIF
jgi:hypothetical protein